MGAKIAEFSVSFLFLFLFLVGPWSALYRCSALNRPEVGKNSAILYVDGTSETRRKMPADLFGVFFEEINHAGTGGLWAELVSNRGFEATDLNKNPKLDPWGIIGGESNVKISTDFSSLFPRNKRALKMEILCKECPDSRVGIFNPGYWGMNIKKGKRYSVTLYVRSLESVDLVVALTDKEGTSPLAHKHIKIDDGSTWKKLQFRLRAKASDPYGMLTLTTTKKGVVWLDQVSVMPEDTHKGHGFREDIFKMIHDLNPGFIRFPGGNYVEGNFLRNSLDWKHTLGPWENRPGHFNDAWNYWTDDGMGHLEYLQLAEDLGALPIWVFSIGISINGLEVDPQFLYPYIQDALDGLEFALGDVHTTWGSVRAAMGHPDPFDLRYVAPGNEDCGKPKYDANYRLFFDAIRQAYPDIKIITNCDYSYGHNSLPADLYEYHTYPTQAIEMYNQYTHFDKSPRSGPKAFVSEYAVWGKAAGNGNLIAALAESAFLMGLEKNSDVVEFASYAPLLVNTHDRVWSPDAIVFDSYRAYGTPSYWMQTFFIASNGANYLNSTLVTTASESLTASAILWHDPKHDNAQFLRVKVVNYGNTTVKFQVVMNQFKEDLIPLLGSKITVLRSNDVMDENTFERPKKVAPLSYYVNTGRHLEVKLYPHSLVALDIPQCEL